MALKHICIERLIAIYLIKYYHVLLYIIIKNNMISEIYKIK